MSEEPKKIYLKDYEPPVFLIESVDLVFDLVEDKTHVKSTLKCVKNPLSKNKENQIVLNGDKLILKSIKLDGMLLDNSQYKMTEDALTIPTELSGFHLEIETEINPLKNTELSGLYYASKIFCTQCEADGFRRITYFPDRPDVMSKFTTTIYANKNKYPVLLSNGNLIASGIEGEKHWVKWEDPFKKPCYLFALVGGDLVTVTDHFVTMNGRLVTLSIFVERENQDKCAHAMEALKKAMKWDEETYGREYDLDIYMIVAVNDFNMGAMENKGLNIFNSKYILARPETATDYDYEHIDAVVGHEYFHNWSGNRVTCRDWFQLSLKEGLTVFREHQFSEDILKSPVKRLDNVKILRISQFPEDSSPLAHPVRPESYIEVNNFYTATVYEKGSEVIRMIRTLLGTENFRKGMDLYFERHDGQAVTIEDFVKAMEDASKRELTQFRLWYSQAGTPEITVSEEYEAKNATFYLTLKQVCPETPGQTHKKPMHIPIAIGLLNDKGKEILPTTVLELKEPEQVFEFKNIEQSPTASILRDFSAPVKIKSPVTDEKLAFLLAHDTNGFTRWDAGLELSKRKIKALMQNVKSKADLKADPLWLKAYQTVIADQKVDPALKALMLTLPSLTECLELESPIDLDAVYQARTFLRKTLAKDFFKEWGSIYNQNHSKKRYEYNPMDVNARSLKNLSLIYRLDSLNASSKDANAVIQLCVDQYHHANNMTDSMGALAAIINYECEAREQMLESFYEKWQFDTLVLDKWFRIQATSELPNTLDVVKKLMKHPAFSLTNPNKVYSLLGAFAQGNLIHFHAKNGQGYKLIADTIIQLNAINPQIAARLLSAFSRWKLFDAERQSKMRSELERILETPKLSRDVFELASKSLK